MDFMASSPGARRAGALRVTYKKWVAVWRKSEILEYGPRTT